MKIDPGAKKGVKQMCDGRNELTQTEITLHMTIEGYVEILYTKKGLVKEIRKTESDLIRSIRKSDLPSEGSLGIKSGKTV
jgi:hypothetical protein